MNLYFYNLIRCVGARGDVHGHLSVQHETKSLIGFGDGRRMALAIRDTLSSIC